MKLLIYYDNMNQRNCAKYYKYKLPLKIKSFWKCPFFAWVLLKINCTERMELLIYYEILIHIDIPIIQCSIIYNYGN